MRRYESSRNVATFAPPPRGVGPGATAIRPARIWRVGRKLYGVCAECDTVVRINKPLLGSLHPCVPCAAHYTESEET